MQRIRVFNLDIYDPLSSRDHQWFEFLHSTQKGKKNRIEPERNLIQWRRTLESKSTGKSKGTTN